MSHYLCYMIVQTRDLRSMHMLWFFGGVFCPNWRCVQVAPGTYGMICEWVASICIYLCPGCKHTVTGCAYNIRSLAAVDVSSIRRRHWQTSKHTQRICHRCDMGALNSERHLSFECPAFEDLRVAYRQLFGRVIAFDMRRFFAHKDQCMCRYVYAMQCICMWTSKFLKSLRVLTSGGQSNWSN